MKIPKAYTGCSSPDSQCTLSDNMHKRKTAITASNCGFSFVAVYLFYKN